MSSVTGLPELIKAKVRSIPDFPKKGVLFRDITPILKDPAAFEAVVNSIAEERQLHTDLVLVLYRSEKRESCRTKPSARVTSLNTIQKPSKCTSTQ